MNYGKPETYEQFIDLLFDHEVKKRQWYWDEDWIEPEPEFVLLYLLRLFSNPGQLLERFSDAQINQGLNLILCNGASNIQHALNDVGLDLHDRVSTVLSIKNIFKDIYNVRCTPASALNYSVKQNPLNDTCYMWWDFSTLFFAHDDEIIIACLDVMRFCLELENLACQESALHGLGHLHSEEKFRGECQNIISNFLHSDSKNVQQLSGYAKAAYKGMVQ